MSCIFFHSMFAGIMMWNNKFDRCSHSYTWLVCMPSRLLRFKSCLLNLNQKQKSNVTNTISFTTAELVSSYWFSYRPTTNTILVSTIINLPFSTAVEMLRIELLKTKINQHQLAKHLTKFYLHYLLYNKRSSTYNARLKRKTCN